MPGEDPRLASPRLVASSSPCHSKPLLTLRPDLMEGAVSTSHRVTTRTFVPETLPQFVSYAGDTVRSPNEYTQHSPVCDGNNCRPPDTYWSTFIGRMSPRIVPLFLISSGDSVGGTKRKMKSAIEELLVACS